MSLRGYYEKCWGDLVRGIRVKGVGYGNRALYGKGTRTSGTGTETEAGKGKGQGQGRERDRRRKRTGTSISGIIPLR